MKTKKERQEFCEKWLLKAFETGLKQDPNDGENSEFYRPMIGLSWAKEMAELIEQHAPEREKETMELKERIDEFFEGWLTYLPDRNWLGEDGKAEIHIRDAFKKDVLELLEQHAKSFLEQYNYEEAVEFIRSHRELMKEYDEIAKHYFNGKFCQTY